MADRALKLWPPSVRRVPKEESRLERVDEVLDDEILDRGVDGLVSTNAIQLYYDLPETVRSWRDVLGADGRTHLQSGNIRHPRVPDGEWIIDASWTYLACAPPG